MRRDQVENEKHKSKGLNANTKKILGIIIIVIIIVVITILFAKNIMKNSEDEDTTEESQGLTLYNTVMGDNVKETSSGIKLNTGTALNTNKKVDGLDITNIQLTLENGITTLLADVTNNTSEATSLKNVTITFLNEDGSELASGSGIIKALEVGESTQLNVAFSANYVAAYDFTVTTK